MEGSRGGQGGCANGDDGDGPGGEVVVDPVEAGEESSGFVESGIGFRGVVDESGENFLEDGGMLSRILVFVRL